MKPILAYALVILGVTQLAGLFVGSIVSLPIAMAVPHSLRFRLVPVLEVFHGAASLTAAITLFWVLAIPVTVLVPLIVACWISFYFLAYQQSRIAWFSCVVGIIVTWTIYSLQFAAS